MSNEPVWMARLRRMQTSSSEEEAFVHQYKLETSLYPNQVLTVEAPQLVTSLVQGLPHCTRAGRVATFEFLVMIACGCLEPFSVPRALVMSTRRALLPAARDAAASQICSDTSPSDASLEAVALLGVLSELSGAGDRKAIDFAVGEYASHGEIQAVQVANEWVTD